MSKSEIIVTEKKRLNIKQFVDEKMKYQNRTFNEYKVVSRKCSSSDEQNSNSNQLSALSTLASIPEEAAIPPKIPANRVKSPTKLSRYSVMLTPRPEKSYLKNQIT